MCTKSCVLGFVFPAETNWPKENGFQGSDYKVPCLDMCLEF